MVMDAFGLGTCNGKQTFQKKVVIGKGERFGIGSLWLSSFPFDSNFQITFYNATQNTTESDLLLSTPAPLNSCALFAPKA
jgi:hypothetical protein